MNSRCQLFGASLALASGLFVGFSDVSIRWSLPLPLHPLPLHLRCRWSATVLSHVGYNPSSHYLHRKMVQGMPSNLLKRGHGCNIVC